MSQDRFYVFLPSNVSSYDYFPENVLCKYITKLPSRLKFEGNWEVALTEISYSHSWFNFPKSEDVRLITFREDMNEPVNLQFTINGETIKSTNYWHFNEDDEIFLKEKGEDDGNLLRADLFPRENLLREERSFLSNIKKGYYTKIENVVKDINETINIVGDQLKPAVLPVVEFHAKGNRIKIVHGIYKNKFPIYVILSERLLNILGFDYNKVQKSIESDMMKYLKKYLKNEAYTPLHFKMKAEFPHDLKAGIHSLYVYSDIVKPSIIGDSHSNILRIVEIPPAQFGSQINIKYNTPYFIPVVSNECETIEINIKDDTNRFIPFEFGRVVVTLEFRKVQ